MSKLGFNNDVLSVPSATSLGNFAGLVFLIRYQIIPGW